MDRHVPRDPGTSPRDVVKVTGWAIRCTIVQNNPEQHLRRSLITLVDGTESPRKDNDEIVETGRDSYDTNVKFVFVGKENGWKGDNETSYPISKSFVHNPDCSPQHGRLHRFFAFWPSFNFSNQPTKRSLSRVISFVLGTAGKSWLQLFVKVDRRKVIDKHYAFV